MVTTCVLFMNVSFTRYSKKYPRPMLSASGLLRIRYTSIRIRNRNNPYLYLYPRLSVFESESDKNVKTNTISMISIRIQSVYIPTRLDKPITLKRASKPLLGFGVLFDNTIKGLTYLYVSMSRCLI